MILKKVKIYNYRQLQKVELDLQNSLTVLAGPNNSGKTTLISVLKGMFRDKKLSFTYSDIPTNLSTSWVEKIIPVFQSIMVENDKNTGISEIICINRREFAICTEKTCHSIGDFPPPRRPPFHQKALPAIPPTELGDTNLLLRVLEYCTAVTFFPKAQCAATACGFQHPSRGTFR